jgi:hypothetical protein
MKFLNKKEIELKSKKESNLIEEDEYSKSLHQLNAFREKLMLGIDCDFTVFQSPMPEEQQDPFPLNSTLKEDPFPPNSTLDVRERRDDLPDTRRRQDNGFLGLDFSDAPASLCTANLHEGSHPQYAEPFWAPSVPPDDDVDAPYDIKPPRYAHAASPAGPLAQPTPRGSYWRVWAVEPGCGAASSLPPAPSPHRVWRGAWAATSPRFAGGGIGCGQDMSYFARLSPYQHDDWDSCGAVRTDGVWGPAPVPCGEGPAGHGSGAQPAVYTQRLAGWSSGPRFARVAGSQPVAMTAGGGGGAGARHALLPAKRPDSGPWWDDGRATPLFAPQRGWAAWCVGARHDSLPLPAQPDPSHRLGPSPPPAPDGAQPDTCAAGRRAVAPGPALDGLPPLPLADVSDDPFHADWPSW